MNLFQKFMAVAKKELNHFGMSSFSGLDDQEIIALNINLKAKMISPFSYQIKESHEVSMKLESLDNTYKDAYEEIKLRLKQGDDVNPFLSKQAINPKFQDYLLLDWNIHHFHLNSNHTSGYFNDRSDYLLMVLFQNNIAHLIDIEHHSDNEVFVKKDYIKIIKDNWPNVIELYELKGVLDIAYNPTNDEIKKLRKSQINACLKIDGKIYGQIGGGITSIGTGVNHIRKAMKWKKYIGSVEKKYKKNKTTVLEDIYTKTGNRFSELNLDFDEPISKRFSKFGIDTQCSAMIFDN